MRSALLCGLLFGLAESDEVSQSYVAVFRQRLQDLGWSEGRNFRIDYRYLFINSNSDAPAFFAKTKSRGAHRIYVGMLYTWKR